MWLFTVILSTNTVFHFPHHEGEEANKLFRDLQYWIRSPDAPDIPKGVCIKDARGKFFMFRTNELIGAEVEKIDQRDYEIKYGKIK